MRRGVAVGLVGCALLLTGGMARATDWHDLDDEELQIEITQNRSLAAYVERNGLPDVAESRFLADRPPWDDHQVVLYYLDRHLEIAFARAFGLGRPEVQISRFQRRLSDKEVSDLGTRARTRSSAQHSSAEHGPAEHASAEPPSTAYANVSTAQGSLSPADRAEAAALRAEDAAGRIETAAVGVERAADRAEAVLVKLSSPPRKK